MNRRYVLALVGSGVSIPGGYVAWNRYRSRSLPERMDVETRYVRGNVFGEPAPEGHDLGPREADHRIVGDEETAADEIAFDETAITFVDETDFEDAYLIVVQTGMQTEPDLALETITRTTGGLHLDIAVEHPWWRGVNDDLGAHSLLVRVTDEPGGIPESVSVTIEGYV